MYLHRIQKGENYLLILPTKQFCLVFLLEDFNSTYICNYISSQQIKFPVSINTFTELLLTLSNNCTSFEENNGNQYNFLGISLQLFSHLAIQPISDTKKCQVCFCGHVRKTYLVLLSVQQLAFHYQPQNQILAQDPSSFPLSEGLEGLFGSSLFEGLQMWLIVSCDCGGKKKKDEKRKKLLKHDFGIST